MRDSQPAAQLTTAGGVRLLLSVSPSHSLNAVINGHALVNRTLQKLGAATSVDQDLHRSGRDG
jgi:hypothetical protein